MDKNKKVVWFCGMQIVIFLLFLSVLLLHWRAEIRPDHGALTILWVTMIFLTLMGCALTFVIWDYIRGVVKFASADVVGVHNKKALEKEEICIYLQPKMGGKTEKIESAEVLVRWQKPDGQVWTPDKFLSVLEETGEILELDYYLMRSRWINGFWTTSYPSTEKLSLKKFSIC